MLFFNCINFQTKRLIAASCPSPLLLVFHYLSLHIHIQGSLRSHKRVRFCGVLRLSLPGWRFGAVLLVLASTKPSGRAQRNQNM